MLKLGVRLPLPLACRLQAASRWIMFRVCPRASTVQARPQTSRTFCPDRRSFSVLRYQIYSPDWWEHEFVDQDVNQKKTCISCVENNLLFVWFKRLKLIWVPLGFGSINYVRQAFQFSPLWMDTFIQWGLMLCDADKQICVGKHVCRFLLSGHIKMDRWTIRNGLVMGT